MLTTMPPLPPRIGARLRPGARRRRAQAAGRPAVITLVGYRRRRRRRGGGLPAAPGQVALQLVRVLVAAERLRAEELAVAVHADEVARRLRRGRGVEEGEFKVELLLHYTVWLLCEVGMSERGERERA